MEIPKQKYETNLKNNHKKSFYKPHRKNKKRRKKDVAEDKDNYFVFIMFSIFMEINFFN